MADMPMFYRPMQIVHDCGMLSRRTGDVRDGLRALQAQGIGGIVTNMPFENYMQDPAEWTRLRECLRACRELGMRVWLYDEKGYPSGYAGGQVLARRPELEARALYFDASTDRLADDRSYEGTHNCNNYYLRARTANLLEADAADEFVRATHERYATELGPDFSTVEAFFTDEPALNTLPMPEIAAARSIPVLDPFDPARKPLPGVPWSAKLAGRFAGRDLRGLFVDQSDSSALRREFYAQVGDSLAEDWFGRLQAWCRSHGVHSSGHLLWEEATIHHVALYGNFLRCLMRLDIPGIDVLRGTPAEGFRHGRRAAALAMSAALLNGTRRIFSESGDFIEQMNEKRVASQAEAAATLAWQAALGVTDFAHYFSFGRCDELSGTSAEEFMPPEQPRLTRSPAEYLAINTAISELLDQVAPAELEADVFLYYPIELLQAAYYPVLQPWDEHARPAELVRIADAFDAALSGLLDAGVIPCLLDARMLSEIRRAPRTDGSGESIPRYEVMRARASAVVLPAGCAPPADGRGAACGDCEEMSAELPARLRERGQSRILKDNPDVCAGVMRRRNRVLLILVNVTDRPQRCCVASHAGRLDRRLEAYQTVVEDVGP